MQHSAHKLTWGGVNINIHGDSSQNNLCLLTCMFAYRCFPVMYLFDVFLCTRVCNFVRQ